MGGGAQDPELPWAGYSSELAVRRRVVVVLLMGDGGGEDVRLQLMKEMGSRWTAGQRKNTVSGDDATAFGKRRREGEED